MKVIFLLPIFLWLLVGCAEKAAPVPSLDDRIQGNWKSTFTRNYYDGAGNKIFEEQENDTVTFKFTKGYVTLSKQNATPKSSKYVLHEIEDEKYILLDTPGGSQHLITFLTEERMYWQVAIAPDNYIENGVAKRAAKMVVVTEFIKQ
ncbi:hypothetical protein AAE02nite_04200 [Adhaeribacter aerolatus]|uniref:Lipocalin-like domain-containing protein n=1 Tax=Adhaeribacter aerolatus TaxID=670289 RepID=A0A512ASS0_9BACT|nr:hypothetical protein [Adhaeribacter aerolatus]GEO02756.1 hypothetical protein AAE02nite_04200 [Adhaeribacter aerolatus]